MKKTMVIALAILGMVAQAWASNVGDTISSFIGTDHIISVPGSQATELTSIILDAGVWDISGQINFYESAEQGTVFVGGNISLNAIELSQDGSTLFTSQQLEHPANITLGIALPSRPVKIDTGMLTVYLVGWSNQPMQPAPSCFAWGFVSATKIKNIGQ